VDSLLFLLPSDLDQERNPSDFFRVLFAYEPSYPFGSHESLLCFFLVTRSISVGGCLVSS
jgi:hypothetical protein